MLRIETPDEAPARPPAAPAPPATTPAPARQANSTADKTLEREVTDRVYAALPSFAEQVEEPYQMSKIAPFFGVLDDLAAAVAHPRMVDVGCGMGLSLELLHRRYPDARLAGLELSGEGCRIAQANTGLPIVQGDAENLPFAGGSLDAVTQIATLHHFFRYPERVLRESLRVLRPGGYLLITDPNVNGENIEVRKRAREVRARVGELLRSLAELTGRELPAPKKGSARHVETEKPIPAEVLSEKLSACGFEVVDSGYMNYTTFEANACGFGWDIAEAIDHYVRAAAPRSAMQMFWIARKSGPAPAASTPPDDARRPGPDVAAPALPGSMCNARKELEDRLRRRLGAVGMAERLDAYSSVLDATPLPRAGAAPRGSVVIIANRFHPGVTRTLGELEPQLGDNDVELVYVLDGPQAELPPKAEQLAARVVRLRETCGVPKARNIGALFCDADVVIFLDDDATPAPDLIARHLAIHRQRPAVQAVRGRCFPRNPDLAVARSRHYDLGEEAMPYYLNLEGNSSVKRGAFFAVKGFPDGLEGGYEGAELSYRLKEAAGEGEPTWYFPDPVILHDFAGGQRHLDRKAQARTRALGTLEAQMPGFADFLNRYRSEWAVRLARRSGGELFETACQAGREIGAGSFVVSHVLKQFSLRELFPSIAWDRLASHEAEAQARLRVGLQLMRVRGYAAALRELRASHHLAPGHDLAALIRQVEEALAGSPPGV